MAVLTKASSHYSVLGVPASAPMEAVKKAYHAKAKELHPDRHPAATPEAREQVGERMKEVTAAYSCLSDPATRADYDNKLRRYVRCLLCLNSTFSHRDFYC